MASNVAVGILRPPHVFFYEIDCKKGEFLVQFIRLKSFALSRFLYWSIFRTKHGYHLIGYPYRKESWQIAKRHFPSDFTMQLKSRWRVKYPQVLRISEKFDLKTGRVVSPKPKRVCGNLFLENTQKYKVMYFAK